MKVVFLDIDGVLNRAAARTPALNRQCVASLNVIVAASRAGVVVSSDWRKHYTAAKITAVRTASAPYRSKSFCGSPASPDDLDIFLPPCKTMPNIKSL